MTTLRAKWCFPNSLLFAQLRYEQYAPEAIRPYNETQRFQLGFFLLLFYKNVYIVTSLKCFSFFNALLKWSTDKKTFIVHLMKESELSTKSLWTFFSTSTIYFVCAMHLVLHRCIVEHGVLCCCSWCFILFMSNFKVLKMYKNVSSIFSKDAF